MRERSHLRFALVSLARPGWLGRGVPARACDLAGALGRFARALGAAGEWVSWWFLAGVVEIALLGGGREMRCV